MMRTCSPLATRTRQVRSSMRVTSAVVSDTDFTLPWPDMPHHASTMASGTAIASTRATRCPRWNPESNEGGAAFTSASP